MTDPINNSNASLINILFANANAVKGHNKTDEQSSQEIKKADQLKQVIDAIKTIGPVVVHDPSLSKLNNNRAPQDNAYSAKFIDTPTTDPTKKFAGVLGLQKDVSLLEGELPPEQGTLAFSLNTILIEELKSLKETGSFLSKQALNMVAVGTTQTSTTLNAVEGMTETQTSFIKDAFNSGIAAAESTESQAFTGIAMSGAGLFSMGAAHALPSGANAARASSLGGGEDAEALMEHNPDLQKVSSLEGVSDAFSLTNEFNDSAAVVDAQPHLAGFNAKAMDEHVDQLSLDINKGKSVSKILKDAEERATVALGKRPETLLERFRGNNNSAQNKAISDGIAKTNKEYKELKASAGEDLYKGVTDISGPQEANAIRMVEYFKANKSNLDVLSITPPEAQGAPSRVNLKLIEEVVGVSGNPKTYKLVSYEGDCDVNPQTGEMTLRNGFKQVPLVPEVGGASPIMELEVSPAFAKQFNLKSNVQLSERATEFAQLGKAAKTYFQERSQEVLTNKIDEASSAKANRHNIENGGTATDIQIERWKNEFKAELTDANPDGIEKQIAATKLASQAFKADIDRRIKTESYEPTEEDQNKYTAYQNLESKLTELKAIKTSLSDSSVKDTQVAFEKIQARAKVLVQSPEFKKVLAASKQNELISSDTKAKLAKLTSKLEAQNAHEATSAQKKFHALTAISTISQATGQMFSGTFGANAQSSQALAQEFGGLNSQMANVTQTVSQEASTTAHSVADASASLGQSESQFVNQMSQNLAQTTGR